MVAMFIKHSLFLALVIFSQCITPLARNLPVSGRDQKLSLSSLVAARRGPGVSHTLNTDNKETLPHINGFYFENPSLDCRYASQPFIYRIFTSLEFDVEHLFAVIHPQANFTVVGHHPLAGHYHDLRHFYINALYRLNNVIRASYPEEYKITLRYIHGGCDQRWSVQEVLFEGRANNGNMPIPTPVAIYSKPYP